MIWWCNFVTIQIIVALLIHIIDKKVLLLLFTAIVQDGGLTTKSGSFLLCVLLLWFCSAILDLSFIRRDKKERMQTLIFQQLVVDCIHKEQLQENLIHLQLIKKTKEQKKRNNRIMTHHSENIWKFAYV